MFAHGYQKLMVDGLGRTTEGFESMSIPVAIFSAAFVTVIEIVGGVLVVLGALLCVVAAFYLVVMVGAAVFVHAANGIFVADNGWELVGAIAALLLALAAAGSGRYGLDHAVQAWQARTQLVAPAPEQEEAADPWTALRADPAARASAFTEVLPMVGVEAPADTLADGEAVPVRRRSRRQSPSPHPER